MKQDSYVPQFLRRGFRRLLRSIWNPELEIVYHEKYAAAFPGLPNDPLRGDRILAFLASEGLIPRCCIHRPRPAWLKTLERIHDSEYLDRVHDLEMLRSIFGVDITADQNDRLLDLQRLHVGGTVRAARLAWKSRHVACNLGGGLHHAHADHGGGFCLFNDVAIAIAELRRKGFDGRAMVIDLDVHDGDGTRAIFADDPNVFTYSIHAAHWDDTKAVASYSQALGSGVDDGTYLEALRESLPERVEAYRPEFFFYLAGCDPAIDDELANWRITAEGMLERDRLVMQEVRRFGRHIPTVIVLAGGYSQEAWRYSGRFLSALLRRGSPLEPPSTEAITLKRYRYIASLFEPGELTGGGVDDNLGLTEEDLYLPAWGQMKETRFLGYFSRHGVEVVLERSGFLDRLRDLGYSHPTLEFQLDDPGGQTIRIYGEPEKVRVLTELRVQRDRRRLDGCELLSIEWLLLQNPRAEFGRIRHRLPGQEYPGLGLLKDVVAMLVVACELTHLDGLVFTPAQFHVAIQWHEHLFFLDPDMRQRFLALLDLFRETPLAEASQAVAQGAVVDCETEEVFKWRPEPMILPVSERAQEAIGQLAEAFRAGGRSYRFAIHRSSQAAVRDPEGSSESAPGSGEER